jgi:hypothetical protein
MQNLAKPSLVFFKQTSRKKFFLAILTIAALSGAVLATHSSPAAAEPDACQGFYLHICLE